MAAYIEARVDVSTLSEFAAPSAECPGTGLLTDAQPTDALWSHAEVLRLEAELVLNTGATNAEKAVETKLLQSLDLAHAQSVPLIRTSERRQPGTPLATHRTHRQGPKSPQPDILPIYRRLCDERLVERAPAD